MSMQVYLLRLADPRALREQLAIKVRILSPEIQPIVFDEGMAALMKGRMFRFFTLMRWLDELATEEEFHHVPRWFNC